MSADHLNTDNSFVGRAPFLDVYPVCSQLVSEIGRAFIRSWNVEQASMFRSELIDKLVSSGISRERAELSWKLVVQEHGKTSNSSNAVNQLNPSINIQKAPGNSPSSDRLTTESGNENENVFSFEDGRWVVRFCNQTIYPQNITGIKYLHFLISNSGVTFPPGELYDGFGGRHSKKKPNSMSAQDAMVSGVSFTAAKPDVAVDEKGKQDMLARLDNIEREMASAKLVPDADLIEKLAAERIRIQEYLRKAFTPVGNRRIQEPDVVRRMKAVDIAIRRAKEKIQRAGHQELLRHLEQSVEVKVRSGCRYEGDGFTWRTQPVEFIVPGQPR